LLGQSLDIRATKNWLHGFYKLELWCIVSPR
jgi:hypothetical protein